LSPPKARATNGERTITRTWNRPQSDLLRAVAARKHRYIDLEGGVRSGKTTVGIWALINLAIEFPGIKMLLARWTGDALGMQLKPKFYEECPKELLGTWLGKEECQTFTNGSMLYIRSLKSADDAARFCIAPETLVLKNDLTWARADVIQEGDIVVGVDEDPIGGGRGDKRRLLHSLVEGVRTFEDERLRIRTTYGDIIVNEQHPFLVPRRPVAGPARSKAEWIEARHLVAGMPIKFLAPPWPDRSDTWFAGILDGEGWCPMTRQNRVLGFAQNPGEVLTRALITVIDLGLHPRVYTKHEADACIAVDFCRIGEIIRILGSFRPVRLLPKIEAILDGSQALPQKDDKAIVLSVERIGRGPVIGIQTSTRTLITNGFVSHNSKTTGLTLAVICVDQAEEMPEDIYRALKGRLSQPSYPQMMILLPNPPGMNHWLVEEFPEDNRIDNHLYLNISLYDNRTIIGDAYIRELEMEYPLGHAMRRRMIDGKRGLSIEGEAVYRNVFLRDTHSREVDFFPDYPVYESWDFGQKHPAVSWHQLLPWGHWNILGEYMGTKQFIDQTVPLVAAVRNELFPALTSLQVCCDPAGVQGQGARHTCVEVLNDHLRKVYGPNCGARYQTNSNRPEQRQWCIQQIAAHMGRLVKGRPALLVHPRCPVIVDGFEAGYIYDDRAVLMGSRLPNFRRPKKDGLYDHLQNTIEYIALNFGTAQVQSVDYSKLNARQRLHALQTESDPDEYLGMHRPSHGRAGY